MFIAALLATLSTAGAAPPEPLAERAEQAFDAVDATDAQRTEARSVLAHRREALAGFRDEGEQLRARFRALFLAPEIDRAALEDARIDAVDLLDRSTSVSLGMLADLAEVFTPEQRAVFQERREQMRERWSRWR